MRNSPYYSKNQIFKLLEGEYGDGRSKLNIVFLNIDEQEYSLVLYDNNDLLEIYDIVSLEDLYWANNILMENHDTTDFIMGACRYNGIPFEEYEKIRQSIIRSFI